MAVPVTAESTLLLLMTRNVNVGRSQVESLYAGVSTRSIIHKQTATCRRSRDSSIPQRHRDCPGSSSTSASDRASYDWVGSRDASLYGRSSVEGKCNGKLFVVRRVCRRLRCHRDIARSSESVETKC